jgi:hypothetical protein
MLQLQFDPGSMPDAVTCATRVATRDSVVGLAAGGATGAIGAGVGAGVGTEGADAGAGVGGVVVLVVETGASSGVAATGAVVFRPVAPTAAFVRCERPVSTGSVLITTAAAEDLGIEPRPAELPPEAVTTRPVVASASARTPTEDRRTSLILIRFAREVVVARSDWFSRVSTMC